jgi:hypothetical protein
MTDRRSSPRCEGRRFIMEAGMDTAYDVIDWLRLIGLGGLPGAIGQGKSRWSSASRS